MMLEDKILCCYGKLRYYSIAKVLGVHRQTVYKVMQENGKRPYHVRYDSRGRKINYKY